MGFQQQDSFEMNKLTDSQTQANKKKWNLFLILCCITVSMASFQFGFNIASLNSPTEILQDFIRDNFVLFKRYHDGKRLIKQAEEWLKGNESLLRKSEEIFFIKQTYLSENCVFSEIEEIKAKCEEIKREGKIKLDEANLKYNTSYDSMEGIIQHAKNILKEKRKLFNNKSEELEQGRIKVTRINKHYIWPILNALFVIGGMAGALTSKYVLDYLGRKKGILFNFMFGIVSSILVFTSSYVKSPGCIIASRFLFGIQGGMACSLVPTYLSEISPASLRGQTGVIPQLFITIGILVAQILGVKEIFGNESSWHCLLAFPFIPSLVGLIMFLIFFPESPKTLLSKNKVEESRRALISIRQEPNVEEEIKEILFELGSNSSNENASIFDIFRSLELRWPLITSILLQVVQQLCGINAIFFYSSSIFSNAGIAKNMIQYAILATGVVNVLTTIVCVPLIDRLGRKPLLVYPMIVMSIDFVLLTIFLNNDGVVFANLSIVCIIIFIISFAVGLGPIPFIYTAECFRQHERSSAMAICVTTNWLSSLLLTLLFPLLESLLKKFVFIVFLIIVLLGVISIIIKVPETKGKSAEKIIDKFNFKSSAKYMPTNV